MMLGFTLRLCRLARHKGEPDERGAGRKAFHLSIFKEFIYRMNHAKRHHVFAFPSERT